MRWRNPFRQPAAAAGPTAAGDASLEATRLDNVPQARPGAVAAQDDSAAALADAALSGANSMGHVGRYALKSVLGEGGLGTVYAAWDPLLSRPVAVKTLHLTPNEAGPPGALDELILNEARAAAGLSHPHIVTVFDAGTSDQGVYIAMEPLKGRDLRHLLQEGWRPGFVETAHLVRRVADALAYAHGKGVIHCDVKPANIFMVGRKQPKLLDFGIARVAHRDAPALDGLIAGSPYYLAPEQLQNRPLDRRCDVYSLGVVLFELLTGQRPYGGATLDDIHRSVLSAPQPQARRVHAKVPAALSAIAARAMARDPGARYPSARHLAMDLRHWLDSPEAQALQETPTEQRARHLKWLALGLAGLAAATSLQIWWTNAHRKDVPSVVALRPAAPPPPNRPPPAVATAEHEPQTALPGQDKVHAAPAARAPRLPGPRAARERPHRAESPPLPATGTLSLAVSPWGQIEVDGRPAGTAPPLTRLTLPAGHHTLVVRNADFPPIQRSVDIDPEHPVSLKLHFGS